MIMQSPLADARGQLCNILKVHGIQSDIFNIMMDIGEQYDKASIERMCFPETLKKLMLSKARLITLLLINYSAFFFFFFQFLFETLPKNATKFHSLFLTYSRTMIIIIFKKIAASVYNTNLDVSVNHHLSSSYVG